MEPMEIPASRSEFEYRFSLLRELIRQGKYHFGPQVSMKGLLAVRYLPNGRIDLLSINESARLQANMTYHFRNERINELLEAPPDQDTTDTSEDDGNN